MKHSGFSLIELMVVVAIVGLLSAIAVPAYKQYITKAHQTNDIDYVHRLMGESIAYYNMNGVFGNPATGTASAGGFDPVAMPDDYEGNITDLSMTASSGATCDAVWMMAGINLPVGNQPDIPNDPVLLYIPIAVNDHGVFSRFCYYEYYLTGGSILTGFGEEDHVKTMPGCVRISDIGGDLTDIDTDLVTKLPACQ